MRWSAQRSYTAWGKNCAKIFHKFAQNISISTAQILHFLFILWSCLHIIDKIARKLINAERMIKSHLVPLVATLSASHPRCVCRFGSFLLIFNHRKRRRNNNNKTNKQTNKQTNKKQKQNRKKTNKQKRRRVFAPYESIFLRNRFLIALADFTLKHAKLRKQMSIKFIK